MMSNIYVIFERHATPSPEAAVRFFLNLLPALVLEREGFMVRQ